MSKNYDCITEKEALADYEKIAYDLSKHIACISDLYERCKFINDRMGWDGMFEGDFETAISKLGNVLAACVTYAFEDKYDGSEKGKD